MELTPQAVAGAQFSSVRKGYDPDEVRAFLAKVARGIDGMQSAAGAADARAKAAEAELARMHGEAASAPAPAAPDDTEQMSRLLVLAQRTADAAIGEAQQEARSIVTAAEEKARTAVGDAESRAAEVIAAARTEAREAGEIERSRVAAEVAALERRRAELDADVERLGAEMAAQREHLIAVVDSLRAALEHAGARRRGPSEPPPPRAAPSAAPSAELAAPDVVDLAAAPMPAPHDPFPVDEDAPAPPQLHAVDDEITGEFEPVTGGARDELRDALAERFFDQGTFEDERWKPKA